MKFLRKFKKKIGGVGEGGEWGSVEGASWFFFVKIQDGYKRRIEVFEKIQKIRGGGGSGRVFGLGGGGSGWGGGVRVDVNEELKFL